MDWIGNLFLMLSLWFMGDKKRIGFSIHVLGEAFWFKYAVDHKIYSLAFICIIFALISIRNWYKWGQENLYFNAMISSRYRVKWWQVWK